MGTCSSHRLLPHVHHEDEFKPLSLRRDKLSLKLLIEAPIFLSMFCLSNCNFIPHVLAVAWAPGKLKPPLPSHALVYIGLSNGFLGSSKTRLKANWFMWGIPCDCFEMGTCYSQKVPQEEDTASTPHIFSEQDAHYVILQKLKCWFINL